MESGPTKKYEEYIEDRKAATAVISINSSNVVILNPDTPKRVFPFKTHFEFMGRHITSLYLYFIYGKGKLKRKIVYIVRNYDGQVKRCLLATILT